MSSTMTDAVSRITSEQIERANATDRTPVVFVHGLWLLPSSWNRWAELFEEAGYPAVTPGWPDDPATVEEAKAHPETFAHKMVGQVADHFAGVIGQLKKKPAVVGHSFGGLITQMLAGRGLAAVSVAIDPAPFRGVLPDASYKKQKRNQAVTEITKVPNRGHSLTIDSGWREVAETALAFVKRFA